MLLSWYDVFHRLGFGPHIKCYKCRVSDRGDDDRSSNTTQGCPMKTFTLWAKLFMIEGYEKYMSGGELENDRDKRERESFIESQAMPSPGIPGGRSSFPHAYSHGTPAVSAACFHSFYVHVLSSLSRSTAQRALRCCLSFPWPFISSSSSA